MFNTTVMIKRSLCSYIIKYFLTIKTCFRITLEFAYDIQLGKTKQILRYVARPKLRLKIIYNIYTKNCKKEI